MVCLKMIEVWGQSIPQTIHRSIDIRMFLCGLTFIPYFMCYMFSVAYKLYVYICLYR